MNRIFSIFRALTILKNGNKCIHSQATDTRAVNDTMSICEVRLARPPFDAHTAYRVTARNKNGRAIASAQFTTR